MGGVRLSGKLNQNWRLGLLSIQTADDIVNEIASNNNTMLALQKKMFSRSNLSAFFINRESFEDYDFLDREDEYNRVIGADYNLASADNVWQGKAYLHKSFQPDDKKGNFSSGFFLGRSSRFFNVFTDWAFVDDDFRSDLGFIRRTDILKSATQLETVFWPKSNIVNNYSFALFPIIVWRPDLDFQNTDHEIRLSSKVEMQNLSEFEIGFTNEFTYLTAEDDDFVPSNEENGVPLPNLIGYHYNSGSLLYKSNEAKVFAYELESTIGRFFNGDRFSLKAEAKLRIQPKALISLQVNYDKISLPDPYPSADLWLISPRIELTFSKSLFWNTLIQYSNQADNFGVNSRLQWRFAPLSDLFIVYNDNYFVDRFSPRFRSINLKFTYWLNI